MAFELPNNASSRQLQDPYHYGTILNKQKSLINKTGRNRPFTKAAAFGILGIFLLYLIFAYSVPEGLSENFPELAFWFNRDHVRSVVNSAEQSVLSERRQRKKNEAPPSSPSDHKRADHGSLKKSLIRALTTQPLNAKAFRILGQIYDLEGNTKATRKMMALASKQSLGESLALNYMMKQSIAENDARTAIFYADILMRSKTAELARVSPLVARLFEFPAAQGELVRRLGSNPPWRAAVLKDIPRSGLSDFQAPFLIFAALSDGSSPITEKELSGYIVYLLQRQLYSFAFSIWRSFLPSNAKSSDLIFNGSFERIPSGLPFDWYIAPGSDVRAGIASRPDVVSGHALYVSFGVSRGAFPTIEEMLVLEPGTYRLKGLVMGDIQARRGLKWYVTCVGGGDAGGSRLLDGRIPKWESFEFDVVIPNEKCTAQYLRLIHVFRSPSEQFASGQMWFDDLEISKVQAKQNPTP